METRPSFVDYPEYLICPITLDIFLDPVLVITANPKSSGRTFEREMIEHEITKNGKCPLTQEEIIIYTSNRLALAAVADYLKSNPSATKDRYQLGSYGKPKKSSADLATLIMAREEIFVEKKKQEEEDSSLAWILQNEILSRNIVKEEDRHGSNFVSHTYIQEKAIREAMLESRNQFRKENSKIVKSFSNLGFFARMNCSIPLEGINAEFRTNLLNQIHELHSILIALNSFKEKKDKQNKMDAKFNNTIIEAGPINDAMFAVLQAASESLQQLDVQIIKKAREQYLNQYDLVNGIVISNLSINGNNNLYMFARKSEIVAKQPGYLVNEVVKQTEGFLEHILNNQKKSFYAP